MKLRCFHHQPRTSDVSYRRAVYCAEVGEPLFDAFFNSELGYRGQYFASPEKGLEANRLLLDALTDDLLLWTERGCPAADLRAVAESLSLPSAKAWLSEASLKLCDSCMDEWSPPYRPELEIENGRWERCQHVYAEWGRQAPRFKTLRFFGAFVNAEHCEWVPDHKIGRAKDIWARGWS